MNMCAICLSERCLFQKCLCDRIYVSRAHFDRRPEYEWCEWINCKYMCIFVVKSVLTIRITRDSRSEPRRNWVDGANELHGRHRLAARSLLLCRLSVSVFFFEFYYQFVLQNCFFIQWQAHVGTLRRWNSRTGVNCNKKTAGYGCQGADEQSIRHPSHVLYLFFFILKYKYNYKRYFLFSVKWCCSAIRTVRCEWLCRRPISSRTIGTIERKASGWVRDVPRFPTGRTRQPATV